MSKFDDIKGRKKANQDELDKVIGGGQVEIKKSHKAKEKAGALAPFQVMIDPEEKKKIKALAASHGMNMREVFEEMYDHYRKTHKRFK